MSDNALWLTFVYSHPNFIISRCIVFHRPSTTDHLTHTNRHTDKISCKIDNLHFNMLYFFFAQNKWKGFIYLSSINIDKTSIDVNAISIKKLC